MNILLLNYEYPPLGGGAGLISRYIADGLARRSHNVTVVTTWYPGEPEDIQADGIHPRIIRLKSKRKYTFKSDVFEMISWIRHTKVFLEEHLRQYSYDIAFANFTLPGGEVGKVLYQKHNLPYVIISHGHDIPWFYPRQMWCYHLMTWPRIKSVCRSAAALFVQSPDMMKNARRFMGPSLSEKIHLIHNGADYHMFFSDGGPRCDRFRILFTGRLVQQKDPMAFLEAVKMLRTRNIPFEVKVIGDGPMRSKMMDFVKKNQLQHFVCFVGWVDKSEMPMAYRTAHCLVAPSRNEGMSMAINEALASGLYVFTTAVSCNTSLIHPGINGELVPMQDPAAMAEKLAAFYHTKFLNDYRVPEEEITRIHEEYSWEHIVEQYEAVLLKIVKH